MTSSMLLANLKVVWPPLASAVVMAAAARTVFLLDPAESSVSVLGLAIFVGAGIYLGLIWLLDRQALGSILALVLGVFRRTKRVPTPDPSAGNQLGVLRTED